MSTPVIMIPPSFTPMWKETQGGTGG
jgi:hypothetical protein